MPEQLRGADDATPAIGFPKGPKLRRVTGADVAGALSEGWRDFVTAPMFGLIFGAAYVAAGWFLFACLTLWDTPWAIIPPAIAFPLMGPFVAVGLYEVSRQLSRGETPRWGSVLGAIYRQKDRELAWMAFVMLFVFWVWAYQVRLLLAIFLSDVSFLNAETFAEAILTTENGIAFLATGAVIGAFLYTVLFSLTVIGTPMLMDRDVDIITAISSSVAVVRRAPGAMLTWGVIVAVLTLLALAPAFLGLLIVLPVLGHATWRLYERAVPPASPPAP